MRDEASLSGERLFEVAPPSANALIEALRGVGYSLSTAAADLIDNSISAGAQNVWLNFNYAGKDSTISLLDDGSGMVPAELVRAMTLGARNPTERREANDLGRFGLGLKTASFSQCRRLTVASRRSGTTAVRVLGSGPYSPGERLAAADRSWSRFR